MSQQLEQAATLMGQASHLVALTGAGISTPSGIPDFRSPNSGAWATADPMKVASIFAFKYNPQPFFDWIQPLTQLLLAARPNPAHLALAELERRGNLKAIITQNIDNLHGQAGSMRVYELHGHLREATCQNCHQLVSTANLLPKFARDGQIPRCQCGGILKPNIILFGEQLPLSEFRAAEAAMRLADVVLIVGSSLEVSPAAELPTLALANKAKIIIINYQSTHLDTHAEIVIRADVAEALPQIVERLYG